MAIAFDVSFLAELACMVSNFSAGLRNSRLLARETVVYITEGIFTALIEIR
jgi:hypothetical protein